jgi:hypothetical protein
MQVTRVLEVSRGAGGAKSDGGRPCYTTLGEAKAAPFPKKRIVTAIEALALAALSSDGSEGSSPHDLTPEVQSKMDPHDPSLELKARSATRSVPRPTPEASL